MRSKVGCSAKVLLESGVVVAVAAAKAGIEVESSVTSKEAAAIVRASMSAVEATGAVLGTAAWGRIGSRQLG